MRVFDIQRFSIQDGPGIRTSVFMKGCPLRCRWCHNPESTDRSIQLMYYPHKCTGCGMCKTVCGRGAHIFGGKGHVLDRGRCIVCGKCADVCAEAALETAGYDIGEEELVKIIARDIDFYAETGGGATFTGGEPMMQPETLYRAALLWGGAGIGVAVETASLTPWENFEKINDHVGLFICDLKAVDGETHRRGTGVDNKLILDNLKKMLDRRADTMWIRIPLVAGFNDNEREFGRIAGFLAGYGIARVELLPYHDVGVSKYGALGMDYPLENDGTVEKERIESLKALLKEAGIKNVV
jgi:pyruvate formate lyase activating enzyme